MQYQMLLMTVGLAVALGTAGQWIASLTRMPAIVFLLLLGVVAGPYGLNVVQPASLGAGLRVITSAFVAIILFEGGLSLRPHILKLGLTPVRRLISWGAAITLLGAAILTRLVTELSWSSAFIFASLVVVTGPTVVTPILKRLRLQPRLHTVLKMESILIDPIGVIIAIVVLEYVVALEPDWRATMVGFVGRAGVGIAVGGAAGLMAVAASGARLLQRHENEHLVHLGALALALLTFAVAEAFYSETGVLAVTVAGLVIAAFPIPFRDELEKFKEQLTTLGVSVIFILLAANLKLSVLSRAGWREAALLAGLIFVVRPLSVSLATLATSLSWREKAYASLMAPRGIVAAAMASHFASRLKDHGFGQAEQIEALVFLVIATTVFLYGAWAAPLARLLDVRAERPPGIMLVGVNEWSLALADVLKSHGGLIRFLDSNPFHGERARARGFEVDQGDATDPATFENADLAQMGLLVAMTSNDAVNTLACEAAAGWLGRKNVLQIVSKPFGETPRAGVRTAGRWAMPTVLAHQAICEMLLQDRLELVRQTCDKPIQISHQLTSGGNPLIPLLILDGDRPRIPVDGRMCSSGSTLLALAASNEPVDVGGQNTVGGQQATTQ